MNEFDPYYVWMGIPQDVRPPNHYQLLGVQMFESNPLVIENAADARMRHISSYAIGPHASISQRLLTEISAARVCLCNETKKAEYDERLCIVPEAVKVRPLKANSELPDPAELESQPVNDGAENSFPQVTPMPRLDSFDDSPGDSQAGPTAEQFAVKTNLGGRHAKKNRISPLLVMGLVICSIVVLVALLGLMRS